MKTSLQRVLGLPMLIFYGVGMILGAGIISLITALSYAELSTMYPKAGAEFMQPIL